MGQFLLSKVVLAIMEMRNPPFIISPQKEQNLVEVWSIQRLPFEPKRWLVDLRQGIREGLSSLEGHNSILHAVYGARFRDFCDTENILFYNVGAAHFAHVAQHAIRFERSFSYPDAPELIGDNLHYHRYAIVNDNTGFLYWRDGQQLAQWEDVEISPIASTTKPAFVWYAFKSQPVTILHKPVTPLAQFGLRITVKIPVGKYANIAGFMKPLIDGLIANFHAHNGEGVSLISQRISNDLKRNSTDIAELLCRRDRAILGIRRLLWPYREGVQWNPADELCLATDLRVQTHNRSSWSISGSLFEIEPLNSNR